MIILEHNCTTNEIIEREATAEEIALKAQDELDSFEFENQIVAKAEAKAALLEKLGITEDEAKLLLG